MRDFLPSFSNVLVKQIHADYSIFTIDADLDGPIISTFFDNINIMGLNKSGFIHKIKDELTTALSIIDMNSISFYLGLKVEHD